MYQSKPTEYVHYTNKLYDFTYTSVSKFLQNGIGLKNVFLRPIPFCKTLKTVLTKENTYFYCLLGQMHEIELSWNLSTR